MIRSYFSYVPSGLSVRFLNLSSGNPDSFNWDFGFQEEIPGTPSYASQRVDTVADVGGSLGGKYLLLSSTTTTYYFWFNTGGSTDPQIANATGVEVTLPPGSTDEEVGDLLAAAIDSTGEMTTAFMGSHNSVYCLDLTAGEVEEPNSGDSGFTVDLFNQGGTGTPTWQAATSTEEEPIVTFPKAGVYSVTLTITKGVSPNIQTSTLVLPVGVTSLYEGIALPTLILDAILTRLPTALLPDIAGIDAFIKKWQLYLRTLIDPNIAVGDTFDQTKWPALVNDLVINLCLYDILTDKMTGAMGSSVASGSTSSSGGLKKVVQGPAEAEWYSPSESSQTAANIMKPGGLYDQVLNRVCILASRLRIPLEFCPKLTFKGVPPTIYKPPVEYTLSDRDPSRNNEYTDISINPRNIHD